MREVVILSGKGGTGKTSIVGSFAALAESKVLCDCDVDAADLHLLLQPRRSVEHEFRSGQTAFIDSGKCTRCGLCADLCRFGAIADYTVDPASCEGCGFCSHVCPEEAILMLENLAGHWYLSETAYAPMVHARLGIAEANSGKLVSTVRTEAKRVAEQQELDLIITDGPPGIGCPVISSLSGSSLALIVTEPTLSGMHDMERVLGVCQHFQIPALVCINKYDINLQNSKQAEDMCRNQGIEVAARIPYDDAVTEALIRGVPVMEYSRGEAARQIEQLWRKLENTLKQQDGAKTGR